MRGRSLLTQGLPSSDFGAETVIKFDVYDSYTEYFSGTLGKIGLHS